MNCASNERINIECPTVIGTTLCSTFHQLCFSNLSSPLSAASSTRQKARMSERRLAREAYKVASWAAGQMLITSDKSRSEWDAFHLAAHRFVAWAICFIVLSPCLCPSLSLSFHYIRHIYACHHYHYYINARPAALGDVLPQIRFLQC